MRIVFLSQVGISNIDDSNIYADLIRAFINQNHHVTIFSAIERREKWSKESPIIGKNFIIHRVRTFNLQKTTPIEKALGHISFDYLLKRALKKYLDSESYDIALYFTPPITITDSLRYLKVKHSTFNYLWLKDIFPQNALDLGILSKKSPLYIYFKRKEQKFYQISDKIGCMSPANASYLLEQNNDISSDKIEENSNCLDINHQTNNSNQQFDLRSKYSIPKEAKIFIYGGNLGIPQGLSVMMELFQEYANSSKIFIFIIGSGTEFNKIHVWLETLNASNINLIEHLPKEEFNQFVNQSDIGMIFLDPRFTIPNFPSRLLTYLQFKKPVLTFSDDVTDIGTISRINGFGDYAHSGSIDECRLLLGKYLNMDQTDLRKKGDEGYQYLLDNYQSIHSYQKIMDAYFEFDKISIGTKTS